MIDEIKNLHDSGLDWKRLSYFGLEYRYISLYLQGELDYSDMFRTLNTKFISLPRDRKPGSGEWNVRE